jgi:tetratricopeptide (TPR) repeat protein
MVYYKVGIRSEEALEKIVVSPILLTNKADLQVSMVELVEPMENYRALRDNFLTLSLIYVKKAIEDGGLDALTYLAQMDASSIKDPSVKADIIQGKNLFKAGEVVFALPFFQRAIRKDRTNQEANYYIGRILAMNKKYSESIDFYQSAINGTEPYTEAYVALGDTYFSSGEYIEAKNQYQAALNIDNSNIKAKRGLAYIYLFTESLDKASQHFEEIVQVNQNDIDSLNALGSIAIKKRKYDEALLWFEKSLVVEPSNERAKSSLSVVYDRLSEQAMNSGDIDKAIQYITNKIALKKSRETYGMADDIFTRSQLELKKAVHDKSAASDAISDLVYLKEMLGNDNDQKFVFADTDLAIAYFMAGDYEKSKNLIVNSLYTYQDNPEIPVFNRAMHIASTLLLNEDYKFQLHLLTEQIEYLKKPRNIGKDLNQRYELLRQYLSYNENIKMKKKEKLVNVTELAWGMKDAATD